MIKRDWNPSSDFINYSTLHTEHSWEDLYILIEKPTNMHFQEPQVIQGTRGPNLADASS